MALFNILYATLRNTLLRNERSHEKILFKNNNTKKNIM